MKRIYLLALLLASSAALAQDIPNHSVPIGGGPGVVGWRFASPGPTGGCLTSGGATVDPTFVPCGSSSIVTSIVTVYWNGSQWVYQRETGIVITAASSTCQLQEALTYAYAKNLSVIYYGQGNANPCNVTNTSVTVPAQWNNSFYGYGLYFNFSNTGQSGIVFDTQRYGSWNCSGCTINYSGTGVAVNFSPTHAPSGAACTAGSTNCWAIDYIYDLGTIFATGSAPGALILEDVTQGNGASQLLSSTFANNTIRAAALECQGFSSTGIRILTPSNTFQAGGENQYFFGNIEGCTTTEINIGSSGGSANDVNIGTNVFYGNVAHTISTASTFAIEEDASSDIFYLTSANCYNASTGQANIFWGVNATNNIIQTKQAIGCNSVEAGTTQTFAMNNWLPGVWRSFTPTVTCNTGTITTLGAVSGRAIRPNPFGKTVNFQASIAITTIGTCATYVQATLPATANEEFTAVGRETQATGFQLQGKITSGAANVQIQKYDGSCTNGSAPCASGDTIIVSGIYESQ